MGAFAWNLWESDLGARFPRPAVGEEEMDQGCGGCAALAVVLFVLLAAIPAYAFNVLVP